MAVPVWRTVQGQKMPGQGNHNRAERSTPAVGRQYELCATHAETIAERERAKGREVVTLLSPGDAVGVVTSAFIVIHKADGQRQRFLRI